MSHVVDKVLKRVRRKCIYYSVISYIYVFLSKKWSDRIVPKSKHKHGWGVVHVGWRWRERGGGRKAGLPFPSLHLHDAT
jgi:hypothetical protein